MSNDEIQQRMNKRRTIPRQYREAYHLGVKEKLGGYEWYSCPYRNCMCEWYWKRGFNGLPLIHHMDAVDLQ